MRAPVFAVTQACAALFDCCWRAPASALGKLLLTLSSASRRLAAPRDTGEPEHSVVLVDTSYLFPETYRFIDELDGEHEAQPQGVPRASARRRGRKRATASVGTGASKGSTPTTKRTRSSRCAARCASSRSTPGSPAYAATRPRAAQEIPYLEWAGGRWKVHPIAEWTDRDVHRYLTKHNLPYHPLWDKGYVSIGDHHSTKPLHEVATLEETRFNGLKRECGIHQDQPRRPRNGGADARALLRLPARSRPLIGSAISLQ